MRTAWVPGAIFTSPAKSAWVNWLFRLAICPGFYFQLTSIQNFIHAAIEEGRHGGDGSEDRNPVFEIKKPRWCRRPA